MSETATIYDVAELAGVSISTVSLVLNQPTRVSQPTRQKVLDAAQHLRFRPKSEAVSRARTGFGRIGVLAPFTSYVSFHHRLDGILQRLAEVGQGRELVTFDHESIDGTESAFADSLPLTERLDGLILMGVPPTRRVFELASARRFPLVVVDVGAPRFAIPAVLTDDYRGGQLAAEHLLALRSHDPEPRSFAYVGIPQTPTDYEFQSQRREHGFVDALRAAGVPASDIHRRLSPHTIPDATQVGTELLGGIPLPAAVFCFSDEVAAGVLLAARQLGLDVPGQVAVVGFDDSAIAQAADATSVQQPLRESGRLAVDLLLGQLHGEGPPATAADAVPESAPAPPAPAVLPIGLTVRGSTVQAGVPAGIRDGDS